MDLYERQDRRPVAVFVTSDGRRVPAPIDPEPVTFLSLIRSLVVGLEGLVLLITGSRRENGGTRRRDRS